MIITIGLYISLFAIYLPSWVYNAERDLLEQNLPTIRQQFIDMGILSSRDKNYFIYVGNHDNDLWEMQTRIGLMKPDCPPEVEGLYRLPDLKTCQDNYNMLCSYIAYLKGLLPYYGPVQQTELENVIADSLWRKKVWGAMWDYHGNYSHGARLALQDLRELVGQEDYYNSNWPDPLPLSGYDMIWP